MDSKNYLWNVIRFFEKSNNTYLVIYILSVI